MSMTVPEFKAALLREYPTRDWNQMCVRLCWNAVWLTTGIPESQMVTYGSALAALDASTLEPYRSGESATAYVARAPLGAIHHWDQLEDGHDGISLGGGLMLHTSDHAANQEKWAAHVFIAPVLSYSKGRYRGWSATLGRNIPVALVAPQPAPYQRVVNAGGVSIRQEPTSASVKSGFFPPGQFVSMVGWSKGQAVESVDTWFKVADQKWCWAGGFTDQGTHDLVDLTPAPVEPPAEPPVEPEPPVQPPVEPPAEPTPTDPPIEPPAPEKPPAPKPVNMVAVIITAIIGLGTLIAGIITGLIR